ncbi:unnamed protein product [Effrenium voratum]|uniref:Uncharacterized protein n=1 Tax=Effrenium voratum TaxID=2562239 RepID=A0AA36JKP9_9DINO|nr:unnamed protein product [Effrenium voratum]
MASQPKPPPHWAGLGLGSGAESALKQQLQEAQAANEALNAKLQAAKDLWQRLEEAELKECEARKQLTVCQAQLEKLKAELEKRIRRPKGRVTARLLRNLESNIAREMCDARQGFVIQKVTEKHGKTEVRRVAVCPSTSRLKWCHARECLGESSKTLDLTVVQKIEYGPGSRAFKLYPEASPWLCFSLITAERSYDFISSNENSARCFVLSISRLCEGKADGGFRSRRQFESAKGWCKLKTGCQRRGSTMQKAILSALQQAAESLPAIPASESESLVADSTAAVQQEGLAEKPMDLFDFCDELKGESSPKLPAAQPKIGQRPSTTSLAAVSRGLTRWISSSSGSPAGGGWPRPGETWVFTGIVDHVDLYRSADSNEWVNEMTCRGQNSERRMVNIVSVLPQQNMVEIRGTDKLKFVKGWARMVDDNGQWLLEEAPK